MFSISRTKCAEAAACAVGAAYLAAPVATSATLTGTLAAGIAWSGFICSEWCLTFPHRRQWVEPLHLALAPAIGIEADAVRASSYLKLPRDYQAREGKIMKIWLPKEYAGQNNAAIESILRAKLDLNDVTVTTCSKGRRPYVEVRRKFNPPTKAPFTAWMEEIAAASESAPLIGVGPQRRLTSVDLDSESPHVLMAAGTGGAKSETMKGIAAQLMRHGAQLVVLDPKKKSHEWAMDLPMVNYYRSTEEIHNALVRLGEIGEERTYLSKEEEEGLRRLVILVEEVNALSQRLKDHWVEIKPRGGSRTSPAIKALGEIMFMGRSAKMNILMLAQSGTARALGGPEIRENFATRILARHTMNSWKMLVPEATFIPKVTIPGRLVVVKGAHAERVQGIFWSDQEARDWVMGGSPASEPAIGRHVVTVSRDSERTPLTCENVRDVTGNVTPHLTLVKSPERRYKLAEAAREGVVPMSDAALRKAKSRDENFPEPVDGGWTAEQLRQWYTSRTADRTG